jgi:hypothetical protein
MYVILCYRPEADPGQYEPRGIDPFAGIESAGGVHFRLDEANKAALKWRELNPRAHFIVMDAGVNFRPIVLDGS